MSELAPVTLTKFTVLASIDPVTKEISANVSKTTNEVIAEVSLGVGQKGEQGDQGGVGPAGHSPALTWSGDQIAVDGVVSGPHLTGPQGLQGPQGVQGVQGLQGETGLPAHQNVYIGTTTPDFGGETGIWIQTGLPDDGITFWIEDGN